MRRWVLIVTVAAAVLVAGCGEKERLESELAAANTRAAALDSTLVETKAAVESASQRAANLAVALESTTGERDSLAASLRSAETSVGQLRKNLRDTRTLFAQSLDSLRGVNTALAIDIDRWREQLENAEITIANLEQRSGRFRLERDSVYTLIDNLRPWYEYHKQEARRNWLKKLFAAGHAEKPVGPEPVFGPVAPVEELEVSRP